MTPVGKDAMTLKALAGLACGLSGADLDVQPLVGAGGDGHQAERTVLTDTRVFLPAAFLACKENDSRAAVAHAVAHWRHSPRARSAKGLKPMGIALASAIEDARAEALLSREFPGVRTWFADALAPRPAPEDLSFAALVARMDRMLMLPASRDDNYWVNKASEGFHHTLATAGPEDYDAFRALASILANDLGQMRVPFDAQHYTVPSAYRDDNSVLWRFDEDVRQPDEALQTSVSSALPGAREPKNTADSGSAYLISAGFPYPEWNRQLERLRPDWCTVIERRPVGSGSGDAAASQSASRRAYPFRLPQHKQPDPMRRLRRQWDGDELELDRALDVRIEQRLLQQSEPRIFTRPGRRHPTASVLVLLDLSASSNDRLDPAGLSLLDIEKRMALLMAEAAQARGDRLAVHGFSSNTRAEVNYYRLLDFGMPLTAAARHLIGALNGRYSTRLGAALRHASALSRAEPNRRRSILVVSDGVPSDIDAPDPRYLTEDARMAVLEARTSGVRTCCITLDGRAEIDARRIFGARNYAVAGSLSRLPMQLASMYERLLSS